MLELLSEEARQVIADSGWTQPDPAVLEQYEHFFEQHDLLMNAAARSFFAAFGGLKLHISECNPAAAYQWWRVDIEGKYWLPVANRKVLQHEFLEIVLQEELLSPIGSAFYRPVFISPSGIFYVNHTAVQDCYIISYDSIADYMDVATDVCRTFSRVANGNFIMLEDDQLPF